MRLGPSRRTSWVRFFYAFCVFQEAERAFEQRVGRLRAELAGDKEAALSGSRRDAEEELQVGGAKKRGKSHSERCF